MSGNSSLRSHARSLFASLQLVRFLSCQLSSVAGYFATASVVPGLLSSTTLDPEDDLRKHNVEHGCCLMSSLA